MDPGNLIFRVHIHEGHDFGQELQALTCHVTLGDSTRNTPFSVHRDKHVFDTLLQWSTTRQQWRRLSSTGQFICKITVLQKKPGSKSGVSTANVSPGNTQDLNKLGWVVLDLRKAKLNKQYNKDQGGEWYTLVGGKPGVQAPRLRVSYYIEEQITPDTIAEQIESAGQRIPAQTQKAEAGKEQNIHTNSHYDLPVNVSLSTIYSSDIDHMHSPERNVSVSASPETRLQNRTAGQPESTSIDSRQAPQNNPGNSGVQNPHNTGSLRHGDQLVDEATFTDPQGLATAATIQMKDQPSPSEGTGNNQGRLPVVADAYQTPTRHSSSPPSLTALPKQATPQVPQQSLPVLPHQFTASSQEVLSRIRPEDGPAKSFTLTVDVRSFQASKQLPLGACNLYVQAWLPDNLNDLMIQMGAKVPTRMSPLTSRPAVLVNRGEEQPIPNAVGSCEFVCGVFRLAQLLGSEPRLVINVWHKERVQSDILIGLASIPLSPLLQDPWVDGLAPVLALRAASQNSPEQKVQGMLFEKHKLVLYQVNETLKSIRE